MNRKDHWCKQFDCNPVNIALNDITYRESKINDSTENTRARSIYELFLSNLCFLVSSYDGFCDPQEEEEYVRKCNFAQKSLYAEFEFVFKEQTEHGIEALISDRIFSEVCNRMTLDHSFSQKMKLNELSRKLFRDNIGFASFKKNLVKAGKVCLVHKDENLGTLSRIQKKLAEDEVDEIEPREIYTKAGISVVNVYNKNDVNLLFLRLSQMGLSPEKIKYNFRKNMEYKGNDTNFRKISKKVKYEMIEFIENF